MIEVEHLDLRSITESKQVTTHFYLAPLSGGNEVKWIKCGQIYMWHSDVRGLDRWTIGARLARGATDFEEDRAHAFAFDLIAVKFKMLFGILDFAGVIAPCLTVRGEEPHGFCDFHVPPVGYDPFKEAKPCKQRGCKPKGHPIVPEGCYQAKANPELHEKLTGYRVDVTVVLNGEDDE